MATTVHRKLTFYAWRNGLKQRPFDRLAAAKAVKDLEGDPDSVVEIDGTLMAALVSAVGTATKPSRFQLLPVSLKEAPRIQPAAQVDVSEAVRALAGAGIPLLAFELEGARLSDAFLSMTEED